MLRYCIYTFFLVLINYFILSSKLRSNNICPTYDPLNPAGFPNASAPGTNTGTATFIILFCILSIWFSGPPTYICPAWKALSSKSDPPTLSLSAKNVAIALCVGITWFESSANVGSVLNSLTTAPEPPSLTPPSDSSDKPSKSKNSALIVTTPVACCTLNNSPALKLPS